MSIDSLNSANLNVNQPEVPVKDSVNVQFRANDNNKLQRTPQQDEFVKKNNVGVKVGIGAVLATIVAGTADAVFNDGKNLKKIFKNFGKKPKGPVKDIDLGVKTPEERKVLDEAIGRLKGKTSETANSAGTKTAGEAVGGSKRGYTGNSSSSSSSSSSSKGKSRGKSEGAKAEVKAEPKVEPKAEPEVKHEEPKVEGKKGKKKVEKTKTEVGSEKFVPKKINTIDEANKFVENLETECEQKIKSLGFDDEKLDEAINALFKKYDIEKLKGCSAEQFDKILDDMATEYGRIMKSDEVLPILQDYQARLVAMSQRNHSLSPEIAEIFSNKAFELDETIKYASPEEFKKMLRAEFKKGIEIDKKVQTFKQHLNGKMNVQVGTKKSKELQELADHYHAEELRSAAKDKGLRPDPLASAQAVLSDGALDNMEWVSRNLTEDESLRRALDIPRKFKVEYSDAIKQPYVKTNKGRYIVLDRETQLWHEFDKSTWEQISSRRKSWYENAISLTRSNEEGEVLRKIRPRNGGKAKFVLQVPEKQGRIVYDKNGATKYQGREKEVLNETLHETELNAVLFGTPEHRAYTKHTPDGKVSGTIQQYVSTYPEGTFQKSSKRITLFENGSPKTVKLAYEGEDFDIDVYGRILKKQKMRDPVREQAIAREQEYSHSRPSSYASNSSRNRRKVNA